ncbi:MAG: transglutaminase domain-containing protein, partial [Christensenellales bacterium]
ANPTRALMFSSDKSNVVTYNYTQSKTQIIAISTNVEVSEDININFSISGTRVTFVPVNGIDSYEIYLYSQSTGLNIYPVTTTTIELQSTTFNLKDEIYAVRMGAVIENQHLVCSDIKFVNPDNYSGYTNKIYMFDGYINDYYIETLQELRNIVYYTFITRQSEFDIKLSTNFQNNIISTYSGSNTATKLLSAISDSFNYMYETRNAYELSSSAIESNKNTYRISINYDDYLNSNGLPACELNNVPNENYYFPEAEWVPYYEKSTHTMRNKDEKYDTPYDNFASDKQILYTSVSSSEELYWAVENKITPIVDKNSMAETIYTKAKSVLNSIISDEMTDYEKVLSIFDWICANTSYDYYSLQDGAYSTESVTIVPAYYLEGVFLTGYAVCDGFSKAFSLMCNMEGIDAIRIVGTAVSGGSQGGHAWNKVLLDKNPEDDILAEYYLVDITWTTLISADNSNEISTHQYFLLSDNDVATTHYQYEKRTKFEYYTASVNYDYYDITTFIYKDNPYDLVIDSDEDLSALFYYMLDSTLPSMEVVIDYNYMYNNYISSGGTVYGAMNYNNIVKAMIEKMRSKKFNEQYFTLNSDSWGVIKYNQAGDTGVIMVFDQAFLIDADNEAGHLIEYLSNNKIYNNFELYVTTDMLNTVTGTTYLDKVKKLFQTAINSHTDIQITFEFVEENNNNEVQFVMNVTSA